MRERPYDDAGNRLFGIESVRDPMGRLAATRSARPSGVHGALEAAQQPEYRRSL